MDAARHLHVLVVCGLDPLHPFQPVALLVPVIPDTLKDFILRLGGLLVVRLELGVETLDALHFLDTLRVLTQLRGIIHQDGLDDWLDLNRVFVVVPRGIVVIRGLQRVLLQHGRCLLGCCKQQVAVPDLEILFLGQIRHGGNVVRDVLRGFHFCDAFGH